MTKKKKWLIITTAIVALIAIIAGVSYAAWDNGNAKSDLEVAIGGRVALTVKVDTTGADTKKLVPSGQLDLQAKPNDYTAKKTLGTIDVKIDAKHTADSLAMVYQVKEIFAVPADKTLSDAVAARKTLKDANKTAAEIAEGLKDQGIVDLNVKHEYVDESNVTHSVSRYTTQAPAAGATLEEGMDLLINFNGADTGALAADTELAFNTTGVGDAAQLYTVSIEFLRKASDDFVTFEDFVNKKIVIQFYIEAVVAQPTTN